MTVDEGEECRDLRRGPQIIYNHARFDSDVRYHLTLLNLIFSSLRRSFDLSIIRVATLSNCSCDTCCPLTSILMFYYMPDSWYCARSDARITGRSRFTPARSAECQASRSLPAA